MGCSLLGMQSPRKVPKLTKIKHGRVARADLKESCEIFYVLAIGWPLIYATRVELESVNSWNCSTTPCLCCILAKLLDDEGGGRVEWGKEKAKMPEKLLPVLLSAHMVAT